MDKDTVKCKRCGKEIPAEEAIFLRRAQANVINVENWHRTRYETIKWVTKEQAGKMILCRACDDELMRWVTNGRV